MPSPENTPQLSLFAVKDLSGRKFVMEYAWKEATPRNDEEYTPTPILRTDVIVPKVDPYVLMLDFLDYGCIQLDARNMFCGNVRTREIHHSLSSQIECCVHQETW